MYMKEGCDKCHGHLGFKLGDFRGGVDVSIPLAPYLAAKTEAVNVSALTHAGIWLLGLTGFGFGVRQVRRHIFERDRAKAEVEESQSRLAEVLEIAPEAIISIDADFCIQTFNKGAERIFGFSVDETMGQPLDIRIPERFRTAHRGYLQKFAKSGEASRLMNNRLRVSGQRKDGTGFPAEASISALEHRGEIVLTVILTDVTQREQAEE